MSGTLNRTNEGQSSRLWLTTHLVRQASEQLIVSIPAGESAPSQFTNEVIIPAHARRVTVTRANQVFIDEDGTGHLTITDALLTVNLKDTKGNQIGDDGAITLAALPGSFEVGSFGPSLPPTFADWGFEPRTLVDSSAPGLMGIMGFIDITNNDVAAHGLIWFLAGIIEVELDHDETLPQGGLVVFPNRRHRMY